MATTPLFSEHDVRSFLREAPQPRNYLKNIGLGLAACVAVIAAGFALINLPSLLYINDVAPLTSDEAAASDKEFVPTPTPIVAAAVPTAEPTPVLELPSIPENTVAYSALGISAPISWDAPMDAKTQSSLLAKGTIHLAGTAHPGEKGMVAISGHSSNYPWIKGSYNTVFAPLTRGSTGHLIEINYQNRLYRYSVTKMYEVKPTDVQVLEDHSRSGLRLITCTPVGTSLRRLIIEADQVYPDPNKNAAFTPGSFSGQLPSDR